MSPLTAAFRRDPYHRMLYAATTLPGLIWFGLFAAVGATTQNALVLPAGLAAAVLLAVVTAPLERIRLSWFRREPAQGRRGFWAEIGYLLVSVLTGAAGLGLALGWLVVSVRNLVIFPLYYSWATDLSEAWGGPTQAGAVIVHVLGGFAVFLAVPWLLRHLATFQAALADRLLVTSRSPVAHSL
jgi:hypothetical protein